MVVVVVVVAMEVEIISVPNTTVDPSGIWILLWGLLYFDSSHFGPSSS